LPESNSSAGAGDGAASQEKKISGAAIPVNAADFELNERSLSDGRYRDRDPSISHDGAHVRAL
jgi:hypothetical protein